MLFFKLGIDPRYVGRPARSLGIVLTYNIMDPLVTETSHKLIQ